MITVNTVQMIDLLVHQLHLACAAVPTVVWWLSGAITKVGELESTLNQSINQPINQSKHFNLLSLD